MKIAILTDIHGNHLALQAVLEKIDQMENIQEIWVLGDMIAMGPDTNEVLNTLFSRKDVKMITGNHDEAILSLLSEEGHPESYRHTREHHEWIANQLTEENQTRLQALPRVIQRTIDSTRIVGIHYHIEEAKRSSHIKDEPFFSIQEATLENMEKLFGDYPADIICFGHHHPEHFFVDKGKTYLNPGALGVSKDNKAPFAVIDFSQTPPIPEIHHAIYDKAAFLQRLEDLKVPQREILRKLFFVGE